MRKVRWNRHDDERGQGLVEYAIIVSLVSAACAAALTLLGVQIVATLYEPVIRAFP